MFFWKVDSNKIFNLKINLNFPWILKYFKVVTLHVYFYKLKKNISSKFVYKCYFKYNFKK